MKKFCFTGNRYSRIRIVNIIIFAAALLAALTLTGKIVRAKFIGDSTTIVNGFYAEKKNDIDLLVVGSSNSFCTIDPVILYDGYGIAAYDFGSSSQPMNISAFYLKEAFKKQKPKVVALEANMMVGGSTGIKNEAALRWGFTDIPLSVNKLRCIYQSVGSVDREYFSYVFPVFRYHDRWKELSKTDYTYFYSDKTNYTKGYLETQSVTETAVDLSGYDSEGVAWIEEANVDFLDEMIRLCDKNGAELMLFKSPREDWHRYETEAVKSIARQKGLQFVDYNELYHNGEIVLDTGADFRDGQHLNDFGAEKVTLHFGQYMKEHFEIPDRRGEEVPNSWDKASLYRKHKGWQEYMGAENAHACLEQLQNDGNYIIMVTKNAADGAGQEQWVYRDGAVALHKAWDENGIEHMRIGKSRLVLSKLGVVYQVLIDGVEYYQTGHRWNIIVYDKVTQEITALVFDE